MGSSKIPKDSLYSVQERPAKRVKLLEDSDSDTSSDENGGVALAGEADFKVNKEYARRFEHNQKRAELHRLEEKFKSPKRNSGEQLDDNEEESSSEDEEDDDGILASGQLDEEVNATLKALRNKDPSVYDKNTTFYTAAVDDGYTPEGAKPPKSQEKAVNLRDYHRDNLLHGNTELQEDITLPTYAQEQEEIRQALVRELHSKAEDGSIDEHEVGTIEEGENGFLVKKTSSKDLSRPKNQQILNQVDVDTADRDPEAFLSKFLNSRGWIAPSGSVLQPFESDDEEEDNRAEEFEQAYNLRFENPEGANEKLVSHARDVAAKYSVRQETTNKRKRARDAERVKREEERQERANEKARLRKLRLEEAETKLKKIKDAAGISDQQINLEEWQQFLTEDWDDQQWETEMKGKFGDDYYTGEDFDSDRQESISRRKVRKPKWNEDIDITDLIPDFHDDDATFSLSDVENDGVKASSSKKKKKVREEEKRQARRERRQMEQLVDEKLDLDFAVNSNGNKAGPSQFRYRDTSPTAYGLTPKDILMATDSQLNQYAGLKKMASFRDSEKKKKDKKRLGKKARLREWRKETFGNEHGSQKSLQEFIQEAHGDVDAEAVVGNDQETSLDSREGKRRKRSKKDRS